ncbi:hypothetical protein LAZ67_22001147, partial [Cordylochernes scorpioides]
MLTVFFDYQGIVHHQFQQQGSTITADSYLGVLRRLREAIRQKRPELWRRKSWILHHDNAPAHTALKISKFLQDHSSSVFPQPPTVPIWPPATSFFFFLKFQNIEEIKVESKMAIEAIPKTDYQRCFADWKKRWLKCVAANGDYFEGDNLNLCIDNIGVLRTERRPKTAILVFYGQKEGLKQQYWCSKDRKNAQNNNIGVLRAGQKGQKTAYINNIDQTSYRHAVIFKEKQGNV